MRYRWVVAFGLVLGLLAARGFGERRASTGFVAFSGTETVGQCEGFSILVDYVDTMRWMDLVDKNGEWKRSKVSFHVIWDLYYNSEDPRKAVAGGPCEAEVEHLDPTTGVIVWSGDLWKVKVPGYGRILSETGRAVLQCDPISFNNCRLVSNTGHNQFLDADLNALCDYLK